jgi:diguanylate cyclase (GGDEF)-like protein
MRPDSTTRAAVDVQDACRAAVDAFAVAHAELLPSVYVERGGRLRCMASSGYWQVRDGVPPSAGILGRTYRTGVETITQDVESCEEYLGAAAGVCAEACLPIFSGDGIAGVLNIEGRRPLRQEELAAARKAAERLGRRIDELGGPPVESVPQRLTRHATRLGALLDTDAVERGIVAAAIDLSPMDSALLLAVREDGSIEQRVAAGPLESVLMDAGPEALAAIFEFVSAGSSCYTAGDPDDEGTAGMGSLRSAGAGSVAAFGALMGDEMAVLVLADADPVYLTTGRVELLELLIAHGATCLQAAGAVSELRALAATDPLTGLGHHATFHAALSAVRGRSDVAVLLCDVDGFKAYNDSRGHQAGDRLLTEISAAMSNALRRDDGVYRVGGDEFAALIRVAGEQEAIDTGTRLREAVAQVGGGITISIGVARALPNEPGAALLARADRALYAVKEAGRNGVFLAPAPQLPLPI